jgi:prophage antirepressor-like protein
MMDTKIIQKNIINNKNNSIIGSKQIENSIDFENNQFKYANKKFSFVKIDDNEIYFRAKDIADFLEHNNTNQAIMLYISDDEKISLEILSKFRGMENRPANLDDKNSVYISEVGLYELIFSSKKKQAKNFKKFVAKELLPILHKSDFCGLSNKVNLYTLGYKSIFDDSNNLSKFNEKRVVYIGVIGIFENSVLCKFGTTSDIFRRFYIEHIVTFGNQFKIIYIAETDNNDEVEKYFKKEIAILNLNKKLMFNGKMRTELFIAGTNFTTDDAINLMDDLIKKYPLESNQIRDEKIKELENNLNNKDFMIAKETEITKRIAIEKSLEKEKEITKRTEIEKTLELEKEKIILEQKFQETRNLEIKINNTVKKDENLYLQFLNENTEKSDRHIKTTDLYDYFKIWFEDKNPNAKIPSNKEFVSNIKIYKVVEQVKINKKSCYGIKKLKLKN